MDEATALLLTLEVTSPDAPAACEGWTAHELVAHLAAGAAEMAGLVEASLAGEPDRTTAAFGEREAPFVALEDDVLRERLVVEALRLNAAVDALGPSASVAFSGRRLTAAELGMHGRSEAALHRWDLAGDDDISRELLAQPELTSHAVTVLNDMLAESCEAPAGRAAAAGIRELRAAIGSPGQPDVVLVVAEDGGARFELADACASPVLRTDAATRLLALWGRRSSRGELVWADSSVAAQLERVLWSDRPQPVDLSAPDGSPGTHVVGVSTAGRGRISSVSGARLWRGTWHRRLRG